MKIDLNTSLKNNIHENSLTKTIMTSDPLRNNVDDDFIDRNIKQEGVSIDDLEVPPFLRKHPGALRRLRSGTL